jgi:N-acetyl-gamma-glutamyl-phosphate/LysW-gamma-L-alpha-aminoadipyl-6-phosphate reductase
MSVTASVVGASGFVGGELLRLLADHPEFTLKEATSREYSGRTIGGVHPNLRDLGMRFCDPEDLSSVDVLFAATPHGVSMANIDRFRKLADTVVDLSSDFRLGDVEAYSQYYGRHDRPALLADATYALPELHREALTDTDIIAVGGCNATATILALAPLVEANLLDTTDQIVVDVKVGSSEGGASGGRASAHPERSGVVRPYAAVDHRHEAEIEQELGRGLSFTAHAVDMIRGAAATCHTFPGPITKQDVWDAYRGAYGGEPFVRLLGGSGGIYRYPEPKVVAGTNFVEVAFESDPENDRLVVFAAIDNMMKGSAGQAVHAANIALGLEETAGLEFRGLHPVGAP